MATQKIAIMGDAHANPRALKEAIADAKKLGCGKFWFLGDLTGYGYDVKECLRIVRKNFEVVLLGNHDAVCSERFPLGMGNPNYHQDRLQARQLSEEDLEYLRGLPLVWTDGDIACVHGDFLNPRVFQYILNDGDACDNRFARDERILFCAHLHLASVWEIEADATVSRLTESCTRQVLEPESFTYCLKPDNHYVINCGSVGYPRLERAIVYAIYDQSAQSVSIRRLPFDRETYKRDMTLAGLGIPVWLD